MAGSPALETTVVYKTAGQPAVGSERVVQCHRHALALDLSCMHLFLYD